MRSTEETTGDEQAVPTDGHSRVQSVDRAARLLRAIADAPDAASATTRLAATCGLTRGTTWRLLTTLETHGLTVREPGTSRWMIGPMVADLAGVSRTEIVRRVAHDQLVRLSERSHETAALAVPAAAGLTYVDEVAPDAIVSAAWQGRAVPLHATSTGKALLAAGGDDAFDALEQPLARYTDATVTDLGALREEIAQARLDGYAVCRGEYEPEAWGVSSAVVGPDGVTGVISLWGPAGRMNEQRLAELGRLVARGAAAVAGATAGRSARG